MDARELVARLGTALDAGRLAHAYLVEARDIAEGGQRVREFLARLFCQEKGGPCGTCAACRSIASNTHPDALWVEPEKRSRIISIEQIRALRHVIFETSYAGGWKACVLLAADRLHAAASNAFLKTLEEPPPRCVFFLVTDSPQAVAATILSRCQRVALTVSGSDVPEPLREAVSGVLASRRGGDLIAALAAGDRFAALLKDMKAAAEEQVKRESKERGLEEDEDVLDARASAKYRAARTAAMRVVLSWYRDVFALTAGADAELANPAFGEALRSEAARAGYGAALRNLRLVEEINRQLERNMPERCVLPLGFVRMR